MTDIAGSFQPDEREAQIVSEHLPSGYAFDAEFEGSLTAQGIQADPEQGEQHESSLLLQGGDIHRDLFKMNRNPPVLHKRAATFSQPHIDGDSNPWRDSEELTAAEHLAPNGFRRQFVQRKFGDRFDFRESRVTRSFVEYLDLYGNFAGEDLGETDDEDLTADETGDDAAPPAERRPLLGRRKSSKRGQRQGDAGMVKSFFTLLKAFIGTGIMFLPKAFNNGGILFSSLVLISVAIVSMLAFHLLLQCRAQYGGGYGDIGRAIGGKRMQSLILGSITLSQIGFVCAGIVFIAENLYGFAQAVSSTPVDLPMRTIILFQLIVLVPLAFVRDISRLGPVALVADIFILVGLAYIYSYDLSVLVHDGIHPSVQLFNPASFTLTVGSAIFTFEGIGLILPIQSSMKKPQNFEPLLWVVMLLITTIFTSVGALCYATFGAYTRIEIISNYPQNSKLVNAVQFLYSMAVLFGTPVQLFPALRILEGRYFGRQSGKKDARTKWKKNAFRTGLVLICGAISILGASNLDRFVALIGSFACVPLVYIYPPFLHYRGIADEKWMKIGDLVFMVLGVVAMVYTTGVTVVSSFL